MAQHKPELKARWDALLNNNPRTRIRDAAKQLGVSEMELLATGIPATVKLLNDDFKAIMQRLTKVGKTMSLVRNDIAVHERSSNFPQLQFNRNPGVGIATEHIELRTQFSEYFYALAAQTPHGNNTLKSIQFFDKYGHALQKIYLKNEDCIDEWDKLVEEFTDQHFEGFNLASKALESAHYVDIDSQEFKKAWSEMTDIHDETKLLKTFGIRPLDALKVLEHTFAWQVANSAINQLMDAISKQKLKVNVRVSNAGVTQTYSGVFKTTREMGDWMNVLDPNFNLHVLNSAVNQVWVVKKPSKHGTVSSLDVYDNQGNLCLQFSPTNTDLPDHSEKWQAIFETLPKE